MGMYNYVTGLDTGDVVELEPTTDHTHCHNGTCVQGVKCPHTGEFTWVMATRGRWDQEKQCTALPYEPVWVKLGCGCTFGDLAASQPNT